MKKFMLKILLTAMGLLGAAHPSYALDLGRVDIDGYATALNRGAVSSTAGRYELGTQFWTDAQHSVRCTYSFSALGGATTANIKLLGSVLNSNATTLSTCLLPKGAIITDVTVDVITSATSGGSATVALSSGQTASDILAATAYSSFTAGSLVAGIPTGAASTMIKLTADSTPYATVAVSALTAGKFYVLIQYLLSQTL